MHRCTCCGNLCTGKDNIDKLVDEQPLSLAVASELIPLERNALVQWLFHNKKEFPARYMIVGHGGRGLRHRERMLYPSEILKIREMRMRIKSSDVTGDFIGVQETINT